MQRGSCRKRVHKESESWTAYWRVADRQRSKGGFPTRRDAQRHLTTVLHALQTGDYVEPSNVTVADYLTDQWLPGLHIRSTSRESYRHQINGWIIPQLGHVKLSALTAAQVSKWQAGMVGAPRRDGRGTLSSRSAAYASTILRQALGQAVRLGLISRSPADRVECPKVTRPEMKCWSAEEARAFLASVEADRLRACWHLLLLRGLRRGEVLGLRWQDVDLEGTGRISIRQTIVSVGYEMQVSQPKTKRSIRTIPLDPGLVAVLRAHRTAQLEERLAWGPAWTDHGLCFTREDGTPIHPQALRLTFLRLAREAALPRIRLHDLRHTCATLALRAGIPVQVVSAWLGHASTAITTDIYQHISPSMMEEAGALLSAVVLGPS